MKFKNISNVSFRDITLELAKIVPKETVIKPGDIIEINDKDIIERAKASPHYEVVKGNAKVTVDKEGE